MVDVIENSQTKPFKYWFYIKRSPKKLWCNELQYDITTKAVSLIHS